MSQGLTVQAIKSKYSKEQKGFEKSNLWGYFVLRSFSFYPAWLFLRLGVTSANKVTWASFIIGCTGCASLAFGNYVVMLIGVVLVNIWALFDYVDGHIARYRNSCTDYGGFIDGLCDSTMSILVFMCAGIGAFNNPNPSLNLLGQLFFGLGIDKSIFLFLGVWASLLYIFPRFIGDEFIKNFSQGQSDVVAGLRQDVFGRSLYRIASSNIYNITGLVMPVLLLAVIFKFLGIFILLWALIHTGASIALVVQTLRRAKSTIGNQNRE